MREWQSLIGAIGAERAGVDVTELDPVELLAALHAHQLLVVRDQQLDPSSFTLFAGRLGELDAYPFAEPIPGFPHVVKVLKEPGDESNFGGAWHTDTAYLETPPSVTLLYAVDVPERGGDTLFADTVGVFARLSDGFQRTLMGLVGHNTASLVHDAGGGYASVAGQSVAPKQAEVPTEADHPLVIEHPATGRAALFFSLIHTESFVGMTRLESLPLLEQLHELVTAPENTTRLHWAPGTLALWDNRAVQHYPLNDYPGRRREMHRIILKGDRPRAASV
jgi:taurine dioxygenase